VISFASSRPAEEQFPVREFQATCDEVTHGPDVAHILQLGSPTGYGPLRHYLLEQARLNGEAGPDDDILITSGCQQALDLIQRVLVPLGEAVVLEDPVYHGQKNVFTRAGARVLGVPMTAVGMDMAHLERAITSERTQAVVVTSSFQNPTGATMPLEARKQLLRLAIAAGTTVVENAIYADLRYEGEAVPTIKSLDGTGHTVLLRSFSKIAFPGLRVGWIIARRALVARLADAKQWCDLHSDQLSQAILLRFAESGRLASHIEHVRTAGSQRLRAVLSACAQHLPPGTEFTRPEGGMNLWVRLPAPLDASELLPRAQREGVTYLPGRLFGVQQQDAGTLRLSFGGLSPAQIEQGISILGRVFQDELDRTGLAGELSLAPAVV
jgi:2-aminoadipate transaminase